MKARKIVDAIVAAVSASFLLVSPTSALERMKAPRATFTVTCFGAKPGCEGAVATTQQTIAELRKSGNVERAELLHEWMLAELMQEKWTDVRKNLVTTAGKNDLLDKYFGGSSYTAAWYCGLISSVSYTGVAAGDTMSSHAGWTEAGGANAPTYTGNRPALTFAAASGGSKATSSASSFTFSGPGTIKGMFGTTVTTKDGTTGVLYNAVLFSGGDRIVANTDVVNVSVTYSA